MKKNSLLWLVIFILTATTACSPSQTKNKNILILDNLVEPEYLDPQLTVDVAGANVVRQLFEGLTDYNPKNLSIEPALATRWDVSPDGKIYTFYLRENARWSDGSPVTAHDFVYAWRRALDPKTAAKAAYQMYYIKNGKALNTGALQDATQLGVTAVDDTTLRVELEGATPFFTEIVTHTPYRPVKKEVIEKYGEAWSKPEHIVSNGPFMMAEWQLNQRVKLVPNPHYWDREKVKLQEVHFLPLEDRDTALKMFLAGELHYVHEIPSVNIPRIENHPEYIMTPYLATYYLFFNVNHPALKEKRVRQALSLAIDRNQIVKVIHSGIPSAHLTPNGLKNYIPPAGLNFDPARAKALLIEAGFTDAKTFPKIPIVYNTNKNNQLVLEVVQSMWKQHLGIEVQLQNMEWKSLNKLWQTKDYDISRVSWVGDYMDPNTFLDLFLSDSGNNYAGWKNARYDQLVTTAGRTSDASRNNMFSEAETLLLEESPILPLYTWTLPMMISKKVKGFYPNLRDLHPLKEVTLKE